MKYHLALLSRSLQINIGEDVEKRGPWYAIGGNVNWSAILENSMQVPKKLKIGLPYDLAIPLLCICPGKKKRKILIGKDTPRPASPGILMLPPSSAASGPHGDPQVVPLPPPVLPDTHW